MEGATAIGEGSREVVESDRNLRRELTLTQLLLLSLGGIIGSGWLFAVLSAGIAQADGLYPGPAIIIAWIIGGILVLFVALSYSEVSGAIPRSGAIVRYPQYTHGSLSSYILGWAYLLSAVTVPAIEAEAVVGYAAVYLPPLTTSGTNPITGAPIAILTGYGIGFAILLMVAFFFINFFGIRFLGRFNEYGTWWKFVVPTLTFLFLFAAFHGSNFTVGGFAPNGYSPVFLAIPGAGIVFSYLGFRQALEYGGEAKRPGRDVPLATIFSVVIAVILYTLLQVAFIGAINWGSVGLHVGDWAGLPNTSYAAPFFAALSNSGVPFLGAFASLLLLDAWISPSGTGWVYLGTSTRTFYGLSANGFFTRGFLRLHQRYKIPWIALVASLFVGLLFLLPFPSWYALVGFISSATVFTYIMGGTALVSLRRVAPDLKRPFRIGGAWVIAPIAFVAAGLIVYWSGFALLSILVVAILAGYPIYLIFYAPERLGISQNLGSLLGMIFWPLLIGAAVFVYQDIITVATTAPVSTLDSNFWVFWGIVTGLLVGTTLVLQFASRREARQEVLAGWWVVLLIVVILPICYYGGTGGIHVLIPFPWDNVVFIVAAVILWGISVFTAYRTRDLDAVIGIQSGAGPGGTGGLPASPPPATAAEPLGGSADP